MQIYEPAEDSFLMQEVLKNLKIPKKHKILDMGSGTGIQAQTLIQKRIPEKNLTLVDINPDAIKFLKTNFPKSKVIQSNLFSKIKGNFNFIIFNPPYLPEDKREPEDSRIATTGGKNGDEIILKFLKQAKNFLAPYGKILLLTSSLTPRKRIEKFHPKKLASKKIFMEELFVEEINL